MSTNGKAKRGLSIFRAADAVNLSETDLMSPPEMSEETRAAANDRLAAGLSAGTEAKVVVRQNDDEGGFSLLRLWFKANYPLARHTHDSDCLYYVLSGSIVMGRQTLRAGDAFFVPDGAPYQYDAGPDGVEVLEIRRNVAQFDMKIFDARAEQWRAMTETVQTNHERWASMPTSPTMVANRAP